LRKSRALVFPSLWYETLGLVVLEAAAHGIPSIVPDFSAAREIVEDGVTGFHFKGGDESDLRSKMRKLQDPEVAARLGRAAYDHFWASPFSSLDAHISSLQEIYENMLHPTRFERNFDRSRQKGEAKDICATQSTLQ
jgi:glycosyltransferase involved in cell wall biosynthesis